MESLEDTSKTISRGDLYFLPAGVIQLFNGMVWWVWCAERVNLCCFVDFIFR